MPDAGHASTKELTPIISRVLKTALDEPVEEGRYAELAQGMDLFSLVGQNGSPPIG